MLLKILTICLTALILTCGLSNSFAQDGAKKGYESSLIELSETTQSYFRPVTGSVIAVDKQTVRINLGSAHLKTGMRLMSYKEGIDFVHPVTKEPLGKMEIPVGIVEVTSVGDSSSVGTIRSGKDTDFLGAKVKISMSKVKILFSQGSIDWFLGDAYYQILKETGRFELIDAATETDDVKKLISEAKAKGTEAAVHLTTKSEGNTIRLTQRLFWISDGKELTASDVLVESAYVKELKFRAGLFGPQEGEVLLSFQLPFGSQRLVIGDINGDGNPEFIIIAGNRIRVYSPGVDLKLMHEFSVPAADEVLWIDIIDTNNNKKDELLITVLFNNSVSSYLYEFKDGEFRQLWKAADTFARRHGSSIVAQNYDPRYGYDGPVYTMAYQAEGVYKKESPLKIPAGMNIYDFQKVGAPFGKDALIAWDDYGFLNLYDERGVRIWTSPEDLGGFANKFKKESPTAMIDRGEWFIKDRLLVRHNEVLIPKKKPVAGMARGLGYISSEIISYWWNGVSVEERGILEEIGGELLDFGVLGDRLIVLSKPLFGIRFQNIMKGESPFGTMLYIFSIRHK